MDQNKTFYYRGAAGGGLGSLENAEWQKGEFKNHDDAIKKAWQIACEDYDMYEGFYGVLSIEEIMEEEDCSEKEASQIQNDERENNIEYEAQEEKPEDYENDQPN